MTIDPEVTQVSLPERGVTLAVRVRPGRSAELPVLLWGHGLSMSMEHEERNRLIDLGALDDLATVVQYDARGHGASSRCQPEDLSWPHLADDQLALADALGIGSYVAGGASMGCGTALHVAVRAEDRVDGLVLGIPPTAWATRGAQAANYLACADLLDRGDIEQVLDLRRMVPPPAPFAHLPEWRENTEAAMRAMDPIMLATAMRGASSTDLPTSDEVRRITAPALILAWAGDLGHPMSTAEELERLLPHARRPPGDTIADVVAWTEIVRGFLAETTR